MNRRKGLERISTKTQSLFIRRQEKKIQIARRVQMDIAGEDGAENP